MYRSISTLILLLAGPLILSAGNSTPTTTSESLRENLLRQSSANLNISTQKHSDSMIQLGRKAEAQARISGDVEFEFKAGQVQVNAHAIIGNLSQAANKSQELLDRAHNNKSLLATGLALQALGDTYMFSGRTEQADSIFTEAEHYILNHATPATQIELRLQHLHVYLELHKISKAASEIENSRALLPKINAKQRGAYDFLLSGYEMLLALQLNNLQKAGAILQKIDSMRPAESSSLWLHTLRSQYYMQAEEFDKALAYSDSTLMIAQQGTNGNLLRQVLLAKANLLEKMGRSEQAGLFYEQIYNTIDSLHKSQYISQIDSLHVTYWIDQQHMANITQRNKLFTKFIAGLLGLVIITVAVVILVRRKNRQLVLSRLELERLRKESEDSLRTKSLFLSNMSHELRTPLNAITGFASILTDEPDIEDQERRQCSDYIRQNADLLLKLINDVVDLAELKDDMIQFTFAPCEVVSLCRNVLKTVEKVKRTEAQLFFTTELQELQITTDKDRLQQVLINLLINATKFTKVGRITLRLELDSQQNEAVFSIEDTGCGIPPEKQARIFERFEKLHEGIQGAGLGLSICKLIIDHTQGRIWVDPAYTQGARFVFTHPLTHKGTSL